MNCISPKPKFLQEFCYEKSPGAPFTNLTWVRIRPKTSLKSSSRRAEEVCFTGSCIKSCSPYFRPFRIFRFLTFRTAFATLTAMLIGLVVGPFVIDKLREFQIGQYIREEGPKEHQKKSRHAYYGRRAHLHLDPVADLLWSDLSNPFVWMVMLSTLAFGGIGFADDYIKVVNRRNLGLTSRAKMGLQILVSVAIAITLVSAGAAGQLFHAPGSPVLQAIPA